MKRICCLALVLFIIAGCAWHTSSMDSLEETDTVYPKTSPDVEINTNPEENDKPSDDLHGEMGNGYAELPPADQYAFEGSIVLYQGITLDEADGNKNILTPEDAKMSDYKNMSQDIENYEYIRAKYEREYKTYSKGKYLGDFQGIVTPTGLYAYWEVIKDRSASNYDVVKGGAIDFYGDYDPVPRVVRQVQLPCPSIKSENIVEDIKTRFGVRTETKAVQAIDLDGDGTEEYVVYLHDKTVHSIYTVLFSQDKTIVSYLLACTNDPDYFDTEFLASRTEFFDVDGDGVMEIIVNMISYEGIWFNVYKYDQGIFTGEFINECGTRP